MADPAGARRCLAHPGLRRGSAASAARGPVAPPPSDQRPAGSAAAGLSSLATEF